MPEALVVRRVVTVNSWDGPWHEKIRVLHETSSVDMAISRLIQLADELHVKVLQQQQEISRLHNAMDDLRRVNDSHYQRLSKEIDRLKGVHGA